MADANPEDLAALLPARIVDRIQVDTENGCWLWTGPTSKGGYGCVGFEGRTWRVHRLIYARLVHSLDDESKVIDHLCRVKLCCNPGHFELVSLYENSRRAARSRASNTTRPRTRTPGTPRGTPLIPEERMERRRARQRQRYAEDPAFRTRRLEADRRRRADPAYRQREREREKQPAIRARRIEYRRARRRDPGFREAESARQRTPEHRARERELYHLRKQRNQNQSSLF